MIGSTKDLTIDGTIYKIAHAPGLACLRAAAVISNGFAPLLDGYRRAKGGDGERAIAGIAETLADPSLYKNLETLCSIFAPHTQVIYPDGRSFTLGSEGVLDRHFAGQVDALLRWLLAAVEFNLGGFLAEAKSRLEKAGVRTAESPSESPKDAAKSG